MDMLVLMSAASLPPSFSLFSFFYSPSSSFFISSSPSSFSFSFSFSASYQSQDMKFETIRGKVAVKVIDTLNGNLWVSSVNYSYNHLGVIEYKRSLTYCLVGREPGGSALRVSAQLRYRSFFPFFLFNVSFSITFCQGKRVTHNWSTYFDTRGVFVARRPSTTTATTTASARATAEVDMGIVLDDDWSVPNIPPVSLFSLFHWLCHCLYLLLMSKYLFTI